MANDFLLTLHELPSHVVDAVDAAAREEGAYGFTYVGRTPQHDVCGWCSGPDLGFPYSRDLRAAVKRRIIEMGYGSYFGLGGEPDDR